MSTNGTFLDTIVYYFYFTSQNIMLANNSGISLLYMLYSCFHWRAFEAFASFMPAYFIGFCSKLFDKITKYSYAGEYITALYLYADVLLVAHGF